MKCWCVRVNEGRPDSVRSELTGVAVALLCDTPHSAAQLRDAIVALGAPIVYEATPQTLDRDALARSRASVVVVNLDGEQDFDLEPVYDLLDSDHHVVFNDGAVSGGLSGWDHARWMRHLAAKILGGGGDIDPPRPLDAPGVPVRAEPAAGVPGEEAVFAAAPIDRGVPADLLSQTSSPFGEAAGTLDDAALATAAIAAAEFTVEFVPAVDEAVPRPPSRDAADEGLDLIDFDDLPAAPWRDQPGELPSLTAAQQEAGSDLGLIDLDGLPAAPWRDVPGESPPAAAAPQEAGSDFGLIEFDDLVAPLPAPSAGQATTSMTEDAPLGRATEELDATSGDDMAFEPADALDLDFDAVAVAVPDAPDRPAVAAAAQSIAVPDWTLEDLIDDLAEPPPLPPVAVQASDFGIETVCAADYLAPVADEISPPVAAAPLEMTLELIPLEEAVAPAPVQHVTHESWLDSPVSTAPARIGRIWVLAASIGGPESVRQFLAGLPRDYPALFLLAQHLGDEFVEMLAAQLAKASALTVRVAQHGDRVSHGEVLIVPGSQRLLVDATGVVVLERDQQESAFHPSIDRVLRDCADRFGADVGAIVFSGMSDDAVEGCRYLAAKGGSVYAQRPDTCVVSTMVEGVCATGVVSFLGSPSELAAKVSAAAA